MSNENPFMSYPLAKNVKVYDEEGKEIIYNNLDDLTEKLKELLNPSTKVIPLIQDHCIIQINLTKELKELCPKCNLVVDTTKSLNVMWLGSERYVHSECYKTVMDKYILNTIKNFNEL